MGLGKAIAVGLAKEGVVINAGIVFPRPIGEMPLKRWEGVSRVNLTGTFLCTEEMMELAATFLAHQNASGVTRLVATDEEICAWHGLF